MPNQTEPLAEPIRFATNVIIADPSTPGGSRFIVAGQPTPFFDIAEVPPNLREVIATDDDDEPQEENTPRGNFEMGVPYELTSDNRLGRQLKRKVERQVAELQAANEYEEQLEQEAAADVLPEEIARDLEDAHQSDVGLQKAQMGAAARMADDLTERLIAEQEPVALYLKRAGRHYTRAETAKRNSGEPVFRKDPDGTFVFVGTCDSRGDLPDVPIEIP